MWGSCCNNTTIFSNSTFPLCSKSKQLNLNKHVNSLTRFQSRLNFLVRQPHLSPKDHRIVSFRCSSEQAVPSSNPEYQEQKSQKQSKDGFWCIWKLDTSEMSAKVAKLGLAAVLAYGLFDAITYTTFFVLAFLGYEKSTGKNPAANIQALLGIVILMWTGNNVTRPFRVAGAAALAPIIDEGLKKIQKYFKFSKQIFAFALVVVSVAVSCFTLVGLLVLSRWGK